MSNKIISKLCSLRGKGMNRASNFLQVRFQAPNGQALAPGEERETVWLGSKTEVCGSGLASGAGRRGNDEPKRGWQRRRAADPGRACWEGRSGVGGVGRRTPRHPVHGDGGGGRAGPLSPPHSGPVAMARVLPRLPCGPRRATDRPSSRRAGVRGPRGGRFPVPRAGAEREQGRA